MGGALGFYIGHMPGAKEKAGTVGTFLYSKFKLTWLGLASLREGPAAVPAYGGCSLTAYCTVNPVTVTGLSMPLPPHLCEAKRKQGCGGWERKLWHNTWSSPTNKKEEVKQVDSLRSTREGGFFPGGGYITGPPLSPPLQPGYPVCWRLPYRGPQYTRPLPRVAGQGATIPDMAPCLTQP